MAEELRFFLRTGLYVTAVAVVYWLVSYEPAGTVLLVVLALAVAALIAVAAAFAPRTVDDLTGAGGPIRRSLGTLNRVIGFHERPDVAPPLEGGPEIVPLASAWPIVTAAAMVIVGLGLIFGTWLLVPGIALLVVGGVGWLTQLDGR